MYTQKNSPGDMKSASCPECTSKTLLYSRGKVICSDCGFKIGKSFNKFGAIRTTAKDGQKRDSKFEASIADDLLLRKLAGDIKDYDSQYKVECWAYSKGGQKAFVVKHKVDFRIHHNDGSYELYEAKGAITSDYRWRRKCLETLWLPEHPDHIYTVVTQKTFKKY